MEIRPCHALRGFGCDRYETTDRHNAQYALEAGILHDDVLWPALSGQPRSKQIGSSRTNDAARHHEHFAAQITPVEPVAMKKTKHGNASCRARVCQYG